MLLSLSKRYGLILFAAVYTAALVVLHVLGRFPAPGFYDLSHLAGSPVLTIRGRVLNFPQTRWRQTRFLMQGTASPLDAYHGRVAVTLNFPVEDLAPGETIQVRGWLAPPRGPGPRRAFNERAYLSGQRTYAVLKVWSPDALHRLKGSDHQSWGRRAWTFHQHFKQFWFDRLPESEAALLSGMTMGSRGVLPKELKDQCIRAGIYHILVVSGQNMALIIGIGVGLLRLLRIPPRRAIWICLLPILFYTQAVGNDPPVVRAAVMAILILSALALGRDTPVYVPFTLAWVWILLREPEALFGASFQLSFSATASLLAFLPWVRSLSSITRRGLRWLAEAGALSLAVHAGVGPILVYYFHQLSLVGFFANLTVFPVSGAFMIAGLLVGTWGVWRPDSVPNVVIRLMHLSLQRMCQAIAVISGWRWAAVPLPAPSLTVCGIYYVLLICILWKLHHAEK